MAILQPLAVWLGGVSVRSEPGKGGMFGALPLSVLSCEALVKEGFERLDEAGDTRDPGLPETEFTDCRSQIADCRLGEGEDCGPSPANPQAPSTLPSKPRRANAKAASKTREEYLPPADAQVALPSRQAGIGRHPDKTGQGGELPDCRSQLADCRLGEGEDCGPSPANSQAPSALPSKPRRANAKAASKTREEYLPPTDAQVAQKMREFDRVLRQAAKQSCNFQVPFDDCYAVALIAADKAIRRYQPKGASLKTFLNRCVDRALISLHRLKASRFDHLPIEAAESVPAGDEISHLFSECGELIARLPKRSRAVAELIAEGCPSVATACKRLGIRNRHVPRITLVLKQGLRGIVSEG